MSALKGFSKDAKVVKAVEAEQRSQGKRAKRREPGEAPSGYDQDLWTLAIKFQRYAWLDRIELTTDLPVIHDVLADLVDRFEMRGRDTIGSYHQEIHGCTRRSLSGDLAARCWYHWPPHRPADQVARDLTWVEMMEIIMAELWSRVMDEHALDHFRQHFREYGKAAVDHWRNLRIIKGIDAQPTVRPPMRRRVSGGTMADASKEG